MENKKSKKEPELEGRQRIRRILLIIAFLLFPIVFYYLSPALIIMGASEGIITGSFIVFGLMFLSSLLLGRAFCSWICPAGGMQELCFGFWNKRAKGGRYNWIKYFIWVPWISIIIVMAIRAGGYGEVDPFYQTYYGISMASINALVIFIMVLLVILILSYATGKRGFCHYACWMAPFMIIGRKLRNVAIWPSLRLVSDEDRCIDCKKCTKGCPMSLDVNTMVRVKSMENTECILCGMCVDNCPEEVISYKFKSGS